MLIGVVQTVHDDRSALGRQVCLCGVCVLWGGVRDRQTDRHRERERERESECVRTMIIIYWHNVL